MGNLILRNDAIYLHAWQIAAAMNTHPNRWPPVPVRTNKPYLARLCLPLVGMTPGSSLEDINAPALLSTVTGLAVEDGLPWGKFVIRQRVLMPGNLAEDSEAIMMGLISITNYQRGLGLALIADYWNKLVKSENNKFSKGGSALFLGIERVTR